MSYLKKPQTSLQKLHLSNKPKMIITAELRKQIDRLHSRVGTKEWSGELITSEKGVITDLGGWEVKGHDIYLNDIGSSTLTEYTTGEGAWKSSDIVDLFDRFPGLLTGELKAQHIHTHHSMGAFMSGTDWDNLEERASVSNYFIMLVVDFKGEYVARVGYKANVVTAGKPAVPALDRRIEFANNEDGFLALSLAGTETPATAPTTTEMLVVMEMDIVHEPVEQEATDWFDTRFLSVQTSIQEEEKAKKTYTYSSGYPKGDSVYSQDAYKRNVSPQPKLDFDYSDFDSFHQSDWRNTDDYTWESVNGVFQKVYKNKSTSGMTDKEWEKSQQENAPTKMTREQSYAWINSGLYNNPLCTYTASPLNEMKKSNDCNKQELKSEAFDILSNMELHIEQMFPGCDEGFYIDSLKFVNNDLLIKATTNKLATALSVLINKEITKREKQGLCL